MDARRVAYVSHSSLLGGERVLLRLLSALDRARTDPLVVLPSKGPLAAAVEALGIPVRFAPLSWWIPATHWSAAEFLAQLTGLEARAAGLERLLRQENAGLVHTNVIVTLEGALAAARAGLPHVWHSRGLFDDRFPPSYFQDVGFLLETVDRLADSVVCVSEGVRRQMSAACRRTRVIYDGFDAESFLAQPVEPAAAFRARHGLPSSGRLALTLGGLQRRKGLDDLAEAAAGLAARFPDLFFLLAGTESDPGFADQLRQRLRGLGLEQRFRFLGFQDNVSNLLAQADLLVHPSRSEGFGMVLLEAMAAGRPVVATRCGGPEEIVREGETGLLVPPASPAALSVAIDAVLSDPARAVAMGRAGRERVAGFSLARTARETQDLYDELAKAGPGGGEPRRRFAEELLAEVLARASQAAAGGVPATEC